MLFMTEPKTRGFYNFLENPKTIKLFQQKNIKEIKQFESYL